MEITFAGGGNALTCLGCCGTWHHIFSQPPSSSDQVPHATETGMHNLEITCDVLLWFPRLHRAERLARESASLPQHREAKGTTGKKMTRSL